MPDLLAKMQQPIGIEVPIRNLVPGEKYYAFSENRLGGAITTAMRGARFRGTFTEYWTNQAGYTMVRFHDTIYESKDDTYYYGSPEECPHGLYLRVFAAEHGQQSFKYYRAERFTAAEKKELLTRHILRKRRRYERGLTGTTVAGLWIPRDLVREISLKYLTDGRIGCAGRWR
jgi:hypothetical protein